MTTTTSIPESLLAEEIGLPTSVMREFRKKNAPDLPEGEAWQKEGVAIVWTPEGRAGVLRLLGLEKNAGTAPAPAEQPECVALVVVRRVQNPRIVLARLPAGDGALLRLQVRESKNFVTGMLVLKCRPTPTPDLYHHEGRCPRFPGHW